MTPPCWRKARKIRQKATKRTDERLLGFKSSQPMELLEQIEAEDTTLAAKVRRFFRDMAQLIRQTVDAYRGVRPDSPEGRMVQQMKDLCMDLEEAFAQGLYEAGQNFSQGEKVFAGEGGKVKFANRIAELNDSDFLELIENCNQGAYALRTYIPVRKDTPSILLNISSKEGLKPLENRPVIMSVEHVQQCMDDEVAAVDGKRGHALTAKDILNITKSLDNPRYVFFQQDNERYSLVVEYDIGKRNEKGMAIVDVSRDKNPDQMNGFAGGKYNILVTAYVPDHDFLKKYIRSENNMCVYDRLEDTPQRSSGSLVPSLLNSASSNFNLAHSEQTVKANDAIQYRYSGRQDLRQINPLAAAIRADVVHAHEALLQEMTSRGIDQRNAGLAVSALLDAAYNRATQAQIDFLRYMRTEGPYARQYNAALEAVFPSKPTNPVPTVGADDPVVVPGIFVGAGAPASAADRGHSLGSLFPPPAALPLAPHIGPALGAPAAGQVISSPTEDLLAVDNTDQDTRSAAEEQRKINETEDEFAEKTVADFGKHDIIKAERGMASGRRKSYLVPLSKEDKQTISQEIDVIGADKNVFEFRDGCPTGYADKRDKIYISSSVFPSNDGSTHPTDILSVRATLAHEYYGHRANRNTTVAAGSWNDEFRASYLAAKNCPGLTDDDRSMLIVDAMQRAKDAGVSITLNAFMRRCVYGIE